MNLKTIKHVHFTGIKGVGMTALALYFRDMGKTITGSDIEEIFVTDQVLKANDINLKIGFGEHNLDSKPDLVICTAAHNGLNNPEVVAAKRFHIPVMTYAEGLALVSREKKLIATCGVGGKTTTASMIATMLEMSAQDPSYVIGVANINPIGDAGHYDSRGKYIVAEGDDYAISPGVNNNPKFSLLSPKILVVHNIAHDHPDIYKTFSDIKKTFKVFFDKFGRDDVLIASIDNEAVRKLIKGLKAQVITFGVDKVADYQIKNIRFQSGKTMFAVFDTKQNVFTVDLTMEVPGAYNIHNATAAYLVGKFLGLADNKLKHGIESYKGCKRRFEKIGEYRGATVYDDYAHHPNEIVEVLEATRAWFPKDRIVAIFQPHTFSRTKALFSDFAKSFKGADIVGLMDIYASSREASGVGVSSKLLVKAIKNFNSKTYYLGDHKATLSWLKKNVKKGDILLTIGAGDIFRLHKELIPEST